MDNNEPREAQFNSGIAKLFRMGKLREGCHDARAANNHQLWFQCLRGWRSEMNSKFSQKDTTKAIAEQSIAEEYETAILCFLDHKLGQKVTIAGKNGLVGNMDMRNVLFSYELWLGEMEEKYKFGMPDKESALEALR